MTGIERELEALKERALEASATNDRDFYASYLSTDARAILPAGVFDKEAVLGSMKGERAPFAAIRIEDTEIRPLGSAAGVVTYRALYDRGGHEVAVMATTVYERRDGTWQGVLYQQTPLP